MPRLTHAVPQYWSHRTVRATTLRYRRLIERGLFDSHSSFRCEGGSDALAHLGATLYRTGSDHREPSRGIALLGEMVRSLDITGAPRSAEAAGFEAILTGARECCAADDELLAAIAGPLVFLHAAFTQRASGARISLDACGYISLADRRRTPTLV